MCHILPFPIEKKEEFWAIHNEHNYKESKKK